jgi:hypothetical protein
VANKLDVSDMQRMMVAGLAGGIGLCGSACGALGAAIWIRELKRLEKGVGNGKTDFKSPGALRLIDRFLECTDYEFECSKIVGRRFESVDDHAAYLRDGGCSRVIEILASE